MAALQGGYTGPALGGGGGQGLASEAAFRGFAHGAALQQQQQHQQDAAQMALKPGMGGRVREVWATNFDAEMPLLRELITKYPYVSMVSQICPSIPHVLCLLRYTLPIPHTPLILPFSPRTGHGIPWHSSPPHWQL